MPVKGRKSREWRHKPTDRQRILKAIFKPRRAAGPECFPSVKVTGAVQARQLLADALAQVRVNPWHEQEDPWCAG